MYWLVYLCISGLRGVWKCVPVKFWNVWFSLIPQSFSQATELPCAVQPLQMWRENTWKGSQSLILDGPTTSRPESQRSVCTSVWCSDHLCLCMCVYTCMHVYACVAYILVLSVVPYDTHNTVFVFLKYIFFTYDYVWYCSFGKPSHATRTGTPLETHMVSACRCNFSVEATNRRTCRSQKKRILNRKFILSSLCDSVHVPLECM